jgi:hypothetical protein
LDEHALVFVNGPVVVAEGVDVFLVERGVFAGQENGAAGECRNLCLHTQLKGLYACAVLPDARRSNPPKFI